MPLRAVRHPPLAPFDPPLRLRPPARCVGRRGWRAHRAPTAGAAVRAALVAALTALATTLATALATALGAALARAVAEVLARAAGGP